MQWRPPISKMQLGNFKLKKPTIVSKLQTHSLQKNSHISVHSLAFKPHKMKKYFLAYTERQSRSGKQSDAAGHYTSGWMSLQWKFCYSSLIWSDFSQCFPTTGPRTTTEVQLFKQLSKFTLNPDLARHMAEKCCECV